MKEQRDATEKLLKEFTQAKQDLTEEAERKRRQLEENVTNLQRRLNECDEVRMQAYKEKLAQEVRKVLAENEQLKKTNAQLSNERDENKVQCLKM